MNLTILKIILSTVFLTAAAQAWCAIPMALHKNPNQFQYMDTIQLNPAHHIRTAVMHIFRHNNKKDLCSTLEGEAQQHCFALTMPT